MSKKKVALLLMSLGVVMALSGCRKFDKPEFKTIEASQTAFVIPLDGKTSEQGKFMSEEFLQEAKVPTKRVEIPHKWIKTARNTLFFIENGEYVPAVQVIVVERKPVSREWTANKETGTSQKNEGIRAETKESIAFTATFNVTAQIDEADAAKFLYRYNNSGLDQILDTEIRQRIQSNFVEQCSKYALSDLLLHKEDVMKALREDITPYFKDRGITITVIGMSGDFVYDNQKIQDAIDENFKSAKALETQRNENQRVLEKAKADAEAVRIQASTIQDTIKLRELENQAKAIEKWNGQMPNAVGGNGGTIFNIPAGTK